MAADMP